MDLTPAPVDAPTAPARRRSPAAYAVLLVVLVVLGVVVYQALASASLYFYNADEAVAQRQELGDRRFRIQGTVMQGVEEGDDGVTFDIAFNGVRVEARHDGAPPQLFKVGIPVVLEGRWDQAGGDFFASDRILVKHGATYEAEHDDRLQEAEEGGKVPSEPDAADGSSTTSP